MQIIQRFLTKNDCYIANVNRIDSRYVNFQKYGPSGLMLHSVGCPQPSADVFLTNWNKPGVQKMVHAFVDANTGIVKQAQPWNYRGWHCAGSGNNTHIGVEMCESSAIRYISGINIEVLDAAKARADCERTYKAAVELFAFLCKMFALDPMTKICSHKEGYYMGIASGHQDPEHYWRGVGMPYTMDKFRSDVKNKVEDVFDMTENELNALVEAKIAAAEARIRSQYETKLQEVSASLAAAYAQEATLVRNQAYNTAVDVVTGRIGKEILHLSDIPGKATRNEFAPLLEDEFINGGTPKEEDDTDVRMPWAVVRAILVSKRYTDAKLRAFLEDADAECESCRFDPEECPGAGEE